MKSVLAKTVVLLGDLIRNIGFYSGLTLLTLTTIVLSPPGYAALRLFCGYDAGRAVRRIIWVYGRIWTLMTALFVPFTARTGRAEDYPSACIIVVNHQSFFDAFCMGALPIYDIVFVVRSWPFRIPFYGPYMRRGEYLNSETSDCDTFLQDAKERLRRGASVLIFPEGTRSTTGAPGRFYSGAFKLAQEAQVPVVPMCINGTGGFLPRGRIRLRAHPIDVETLPPVHPERFGQYGPRAHLEMRKHVKGLMAEKITGLRREEAPPVSIMATPVTEGE